MTAIYDPHLVPLQIERQAETRYARIYLAVHEKTRDCSLHVKLKADHGFHEEETLQFYLELDRFEDCPFNGGSGRCFSDALGKKQTPEARAVIDATFERYRKHLDDVLMRTWDWRYSMREIGKPQPYADAK